MSEKKSDALREALTGKTEPKETDGAADTAAESKAKPDRLTGKQVTAGFAALALLLLAFFIGMRWIDRRAEELNPTEGVVQTTPERAAGATGKININTATLPELKELYGIGEKKAQAIIDYRNEYGRFTSIEEIKRVEGIGDGIFEAVKDLICVQ